MVHMEFSLALTAIGQLLVVAFSYLEGKRSSFGITSCGQKLLSEASQKHRRSEEWEGEALSVNKEGNRNRSRTFLLESRFNLCGGLNRRCHLWQS